MSNADTTRPDADNATDEPTNAIATTHQPVEVRSLMGGAQAIFRFPNGFGASVVRHWGSHGSGSGLWEMAVISWSEDDWHLTYDTEITDDVIGYLSPADVDEYLTRIKSLDAYGKEQRELTDGVS